MRTKVVVAACGLGLLLVVPAIYYKFAPSSSTPAQPAPATAQDAPATPVAAVPVASHLRKIAPANGAEGVEIAKSSQTDAAAAAYERRAELMQLGASADPNDLKTILTELNNKDGTIRKAALDAAVQFGSKDAIPALQNEMSWTDDPQEKVDIQNAIKFLELPSFDQFTANLNSGKTAQPSN
jgi:hypothetical protein